MIDAKDFDKAARALEHAGFERQAGRTAAWAVKRSANAIRKHVRAAAKPHRRTGHMAGNVRIAPQGQGLGFQATIRAAGPTAHLIAGGVRPHEISPGKVMTIREGNAVVGFATSVSHPGFRGDPFFHKGVEAAMPDVNQIVSQAADTMVRELAYRMRRG